MLSQVVDLGIVTSSLTEGASAIRDALADAQAHIQRLLQEAAAAALRRHLQTVQAQATAKVDLDA
jgi:hypothetical protein